MRQLGSRENEGARTRKRRMNEVDILKKEIVRNPLTLLIKDCYAVSCFNQLGLNLFFSLLKRGMDLNVFLLILTDSKHLMRM